MYRLAYSISISYVIFAMILFCILWYTTKKFLLKRKPFLWKAIVIFAICILIMILFKVTLCRKSITIENQWPELFWSYKLVINNHNYDYFQEIYLNILLFFFVSFCCAEYAETSKKIIIILILLLGLSFFIEMMQYIYNLGLAEFDDIVSNFLGSILGILINRYGYRIFVYVLGGVNYE